MIRQHDKRQGWGRMLRACVYSWRGLRSAWIGERAFREEVVLAAVVIPAAFHFGRTGLERAALIAPMCVVLIVELLNSAIEAIVDRGGGDWDALAGMAKDMGSAAVLLSLGMLLLIWVVVLSDR